MIATMPLLTIHHKTEYRYARPVAFGEHRIMLRPRDGHDLRVRSSRLRIMPEPMSLRWVLVHMVEETGRHAGHADILREQLDGQIGR